jgi:hypothetical protein
MATIKLPAGTHPAIVAILKKAMQGLDPHTKPTSPVVTPAHQQFH